MAVKTCCENVACPVSMTLGLVSPSHKSWLAVGIISSVWNNKCNNRRRLRMKKGFSGSRSTFEFPSQVNLPIPVCTVPSTMNRTSRCNKVDKVRLYASYRLNLLLLKGQAEVRGLRIHQKFFILWVEHFSSLKIYDIFQIIDQEEPF